ncbi:MAG: IclR family transcriptional regulator [Rhodocyclaceae bacterium]|nr:IclR family transcriptional regulator [Rhodocyclaceae bacterium]
MNKVSTLPRTNIMSATPDGAQSLRRAASLLRTLSSRGANGWRLIDLALETGLNHGTVHRMLSCLVQERLVIQVPGSRRYSLGPMAYELGLAAAPHFALERLAASNLSKLSADCRSVVFMNLRSGFDSVCMARHAGSNALKAYTVEVGTRRPLSVSAGGVAILISLPRGEQAAIEAANLQSIGSRDKARQRAVRQMLHRSRQVGYALNLEDIIPGVVAIGMPIRGTSGVPVASISLAAPAATLDELRRTALLQRLREEARRIEGMLEPLRL